MKQLHGSFGIAGENSGRFHIGDEHGIAPRLRVMAGEQHAHLVGEDHPALVVDEAAAVAVAVETEGQIRAMLQHRFGHGREHRRIFRIWVVVGKAEVEIAMEGDHLAARRGDGLWREGARRAVAAGHHHLEGPPNRLARGKVPQVAIAHVR